MQTDRIRQQLSSLQDCQAHGEPIQFICTFSKCMQQKDCCNSGTASTSGGSPYLVCHQCLAKHSEHIHLLATPAQLMGCLPQFVQSHEKELADQDLTITKYRDVLTELRRTINRQIDEAVEYLRTLRATAEKPKEGLSLKQYLHQIKKIHRRSQTLEFVTTTERLEEECVNTVGGIGRQISGVLLKLKDGLKGGSIDASEIRKTFFQADKENKASTHFQQTKVKGPAFDVASQLFRLPVDTPSLSIQLDYDMQDRSKLRFGRIYPESFKTMAHQLKRLKSLARLELTFWDRSFSEEKAGLLAQVFQKMGIKEIVIENKCPSGRQLLEATSLANMPFCRLQIRGK